MKNGDGLIGPGFIAPHSIVAVRHLGDVEIAAVAGSSATARKAEQLRIDRSYESYQSLISDPDISAIHNPTPAIFMIRSIWR